MKMGKVLGITSIFLFLVIIILFTLNYNATNIVVEKNHYYCATPVLIGTITVDTKQNTITQNNTPDYGEPYCSEIEWTLENVFSESPRLLNFFLFGIPILSLTLLIISFITLFAGEGWPKTVSKAILIIFLVFGFFPFLIMIMWVGASGVFYVLLVIWAIVLFIMGRLIINFDKNNKKSRKIITIVLGVIVYGIIVYFTFLMTMLPHATS